MKARRAHTYSAVIENVNILHIIVVILLKKSEHIPFQGSK